MSMQPKLVRVAADWRPTARPDLVAEWDPDWAYIRWCISGTIGFWLLSSVFVYSASFFQEYDTGTSTKIL